MKLQYRTSPTITSEELKVSKMGMDIASMDMMASFLRDQIYTDKVLAPIREYTCNAMDEHIKYGIDRPVELSLTKEGSIYTWKCRDYARGLSDDGIRNIFGMYGNSTKRSDNNQVGVYGVGSKSFFSFTDTYYVTSHHNGVKTCYVCILGGGDKGVPVGEIYEISTEPTDETGIEISADVTKDYGSFVNKTIAFVNQFYPSANIIYKSQTGDCYQPKTPYLTKTIGEYTISKYDDSEWYQLSYNRGVAIRMGGVVYDNTYRGFKLESYANKIVVDVPIGKLTVPMSREAIEVTASNQRTYDAVQKCFDEIRKTERENITVPKFGEYFLSGENKTETFKGEWFNYNFADTFPDTKKLSRCVVRSEPFGLLPTCNANSKWMVYVLPKIKNPKTWLARLNFAFKSLGNSTSYHYVIKTPDVETLMLGSDSLDVSDCVFVDVKKLGLPKLAGIGPQTKYQCIEFNRKRGPWTPDELEEYVQNTLGETEELEEDWYTKVTDIHGLNQRTIGLVSEYSTRSSFWLVNSKKMLEAMLEIGWIDRGSDEYKQKKEEFDTAYQRKRNMDTSESSLKSNVFKTTYHPLVVRAIGKNPKKINRLIAVKKKIMAEKSFRSRVMDSVSSGYLYTSLSRADVRKILNMKD